MTPVTILFIGTLLLVILGVLILFAIAWERGRLEELRRFACAAGVHDWHLMTSGRQGYVRWYRCSRACGATRMLKGSAR